jgi:hypothetical protein
MLGALYRVSADIIGSQFHQRFGNRVLKASSAETRSRTLYQTLRIFRLRASLNWIATGAFINARRAGKTSSFLGIRGYTAAASR